MFVCVLPHLPWAIYPGCLFDLKRNQRETPCRVPVPLEADPGCRARKRSWPARAPQSPECPPPAKRIWDPPKMDGLSLWRPFKPHKKRGTFSRYAQVVWSTLKADEPKPPPSGPIDQIHSFQLGRKQTLFGVSLFSRVPCLGSFKKKKKKKTEHQHFLWILYLKKGGHSPLCCNPQQEPTTVPLCPQVFPWRSPRGRHPSFGILKTGGGFLNSLMWAGLN